MLQVKRNQKTFKVKHFEPGGFRLNYILLPVGFSYNIAVSQAKTGDKVRFFNGGIFPIVAVRRLDMRSANTDILCKMRYGITLKAALQRWQMNAKMEGHGTEAVSTDECLWLIYDDNENNTV